MNRQNLFIITMIIIIGAVLFIGFKPSSMQGEGQAKLFVKRVIDGDTIVLSDDTKVRLIGVDTPELHYSEKLLKDSRRSGKDVKTIQRLGSRAKEFTKEMCLNKAVSLQYDVEKRDRYGRTLAYVYLEDGTFLNAEIIKAGYAQIMTIPPNVKYADLFLSLEQEARKESKGLWRDGAIQTSTVTLDKRYL